MDKAGKEKVLKAADNLINIVMNALKELTDKGEVPPNTVVLEVRINKDITIMELDLSIGQTAIIDLLDVH